MKLKCINIFQGASIRLGLSHFCWYSPLLMNCLTPSSIQNLLSKLSCLCAFGFSFLCSNIENCDEVFAASWKMSYPSLYSDNRFIFPSKWQTKCMLHMSFNCCIIKQLATTNFPKNSGRISWSRGGRVRSNDLSQASQQNSLFRVGPMPQWCPAPARQSNMFLFASKFE